MPAGSLGCAARMRRWGPRGGPWRPAPSPRRSRGRGRPGLVRRGRGPRGRRPGRAFCRAASSSRRRRLIASAEPMRILVFHGYMLRGTGSNIYNLNLARALARLGHEVHLLYQDRETKIDGVAIHNPDIHGLLPVYVKDTYEGFEVKAFPELTDEELDRYVESNVAAVREVAERVGGIDLALANHLVMGPAILARAGVAPFAAKIHGSALEYTVKPHPRFLPYAREGMGAAQGVLVGSRHTAESLWAALPEVGGLKEKTRLGPPGVDTEVFRPRGSGSGVPGPRSRGVPGTPDPDPRRR